MRWGLLVIHAAKKLIQAVGRGFIPGTKPAE